MALENILEDWERCKTLVRKLLTPEQQQILDGPPYWELDPPQRESYLSPLHYVIGLKQYAERVQNR